MSKMLALWETDSGMGGPGDGTTKCIAHFSDVDNALAWLEKREYTLLKYGAFRRHMKDGESRLGEKSYEIRDAGTVDPE